MESLAIRPARISVARLQWLLRLGLLESLRPH
jgi:hypothetical protein